MRRVTHKLRQRLPAALQLQPMTKAQLARCLSCTYSRVEQLTRELQQQRVVRIVGSVKRNSRARPELLWGLPS